MFYQVRTLGKALSTDGAAIGCLSRMRPPVDKEAGALLEALTAVRALVRFQSSVVSFMPDKA